MSPVGVYHRGMTTTTTPYGSAWCATCRTRQPIMDEYLTDSGDALPAFQEFLAQPLACGHSAGDGSDRPAVDPRFRPDPTLVDRLVALQAGARWVSAFAAATPF